jgi:alpha-beta hydrolase superfamily lysophospholipase
MLIVHGVGEHSGRYEHVGGWLAERDFSVEAFDLVGCGATGGARADIEDWATFLDQIEAHLRPMIEDSLPAIVIGHSMGGLLAAEYLASERIHPDLAVLSAPGLAGGAPWQRTLAKILSPVVGGLSIPSGIKGEALSRDPAVGEAYFADPLVVTKATVRFGNALFTAMDRTAANVARITVPTLVLHGTNDTVVPTEASEVFESVPAAERRLYQDLRHELFNEPEGHEIVDEVADWVDARIASS